MKILFLSNNEITYPLVDWLKNDKNEEVICSTNRITPEYLKEILPDMIISYNYRYIIKEDVLEYYDKWIINLHASYLPWNKGADPNLWSFLDDTPKGITIHLIDKGVDTGDILLQKRVYFDEEKETLLSSYKELHVEIQNLFKINWENIKTKHLVPKRQSEEGSMHYIKDFGKIRGILGEEGWDISITELKRRYKYEQK